MFNEKSIKTKKRQLLGVFFFLIPWLELQFDVLFRLNVPGFDFRVSGLYEVGVDFVVGEIEVVWVFIFIGDFSFSESSADELVDFEGQHLVHFWLLDQLLVEDAVLFGQLDLLHYH